MANGFEQITVDDIGTAAGISRSTFPLLSGKGRHPLSALLRPPQASDGHPRRESARRAVDDGDHSRGHAGDARERRPFKVRAQIHGLAGSKLCVESRRREADR